MAKTITATDLTVETLTIKTDDHGNMIGLETQLNVTYGDTRIREQVDIWPMLNVEQQAYLQHLQATIIQNLRTAYLG